MERLVHTAKGPWKSWGGEPCLPNMSMRRSRMACVGPGFGFFADTSSTQTMQKWSVWAFAGTASLFCLFCDIFGQSLTRASQCKKASVIFQGDGGGWCKVSSCSYATYESENTSIYTVDVEFAFGAGLCTQFDFILCLAKKRLAPEAR